METVVSGKLYRSSYRQIIGIKEYVRLFTERIFHFNLNQTIEYASKLFRWEDGGRVRRGHTAQDETKRCTNHCRRVYSTTTYRASAPHSSLKWLRKPFVGFTPIDFRGEITGATERPLFAASPSAAFFFEELPPMVLAPFFSGCYFRRDD